MKEASSFTKIIEFLEQNHLSYHKIEEASLKGLLEIDLSDIRTDLMTEGFEIESIENTITSEDFFIYLKCKVNDKTGLRIKNYPKFIRKEIRNLRKDDLNRLISIKGILKHKSKVEPKVKNIKWDCSSCGNIISIAQFEEKIREPTRCSCGRKGGFNEIIREYIDSQTIKIEEFPEVISDSGQPQARIVILKGKQLTSEENQKFLNFAKRIEILGLPKISNLVKEMYIEAIELIPLEEHDFEVKVTNQDIEKIKEIAKDKPIERLTKCIGTSILGYEMQKEALLLQMVSGVKKTKEDGTSRSGNINYLFVGDPSVAKTQLSLSAKNMTPRARYVSGKGSSGVGLTCAVVKDEITGEWVLEAGALVLANNSTLFIDEIEKMEEEDSAHLNEALSVNQISIQKANVSATLQVNTSVTAIANPKFGRFSQTESVPSQIKVEPSLLERFDLIFPILLESDREKNKELAKFILNDTKIESDIDLKMFMKYIKYCKDFKPQLTDEARENIGSFYDELFQKNKDKSVIPIQPRNLNSLIKLSEASAKLRLSEKVEKEDTERAINLMKYCFEKLGMNFTTGDFDIDKIEGKVSGSKREKLLAIRLIIKDLCGRYNNAPMEYIKMKAEEKGISEFETEQFVFELNKMGEILMGGNNSYIAR